ncbi:MAG: pyridoxamine 5'-phosphate oxidase family protein, partial [Chloroflexota bacterium]
NMYISLESFTMQIVPEAYRDLVSDTSKAIAYLSTTLKSGAPVTAPIWFGVRDDHICFVSSPESLKVKNMVARLAVSLLIQDPDVVYRYIQIRGTYSKDMKESAIEFLHMLSNRYIGKGYPTELGGDDVIVYIKPERVNVFTWDAG